MIISPFFVNARPIARTLLCVNPRLRAIHNISVEISHRICNPPTACSFIVGDKLRTPRLFA